MSGSGSLFKRFKRSILAGVIGVSAVAVTQLPGSPVSAALPQISSVGPDSGSTLGGQRVVVNLSGQINDQLPATVTIDGNPCTDVKIIDNGFRVGCTVPPGSVGSKSVVVTSNSQSNPANNYFTYYAGPNTPEIVDIIRDPVAETFSIYFNPPTSGPAPTSYRVNSCQSDFDVQSTTSPLVLTYAQACSGYGGYSGWLSANGNFAAIFYLKAVNADGPSASTPWYSINTDYVSAPRITNVTSTKYGCFVDFDLPTVVPNGATVNSSYAWMYDEQESGGGAGITAWTVGQTSGRAFVRTSPAGYGVWLSDGQATLKLSYNNFNGFSLPSAEFSCVADPNATTSVPSRPTMTVTPGDNKFTINWNLTNAGSSPIESGTISVVQLDDGQGPIPDPYAQTPTFLDLTYYENTCIDATTFRSQSCSWFNSNGRFAKSEWSDTTNFAFKTSGSVEVTALYDPMQGQFSVPVVNGRTYLIVVWLNNFDEFFDGAGISLGAQYAIVNPVSPPTVTAISPSSGYVAGGTAVEITGTSFASGSTVTIGGAACTSVTVVSATKITCTTPSGTVGARSVVVTSAGASNAANTLYSYTANPNASVPLLVTSSNQASLTQQPGSATALVNGQPVAVTLETPADLPAAAVDPEDRSPAQVQSLQNAADSLVNDLNQASGGNSGLAVVDTPTGANLTGLLDVPVPVENTVLVETGNQATLFAALNQDGSVTEVKPGALIEVRGNGEIGVFASGLTPGDTIELVIMSTPTLIGRYTVDSSGVVRAQAALPNSIGLGNHTLVVASPMVQASLGVQVSAGTLPATGINSSDVPLTIALWLLTGGAFIVVLRRRRVTLD